MPARWIFLDEVDAYPGDIDGEGDPIALAEARTISFGHRAKVFLTSTPTIKGVSRIEREYDLSDQRRYFVPCPQCGGMQWLRFERLRWAKGRPETARYTALPYRVYLKPLRILVARKVIAATQTMDGPAGVSST